MATWNPNGLTPNKDDVGLLLKEHKLDVMLISEAHCTTSSSVKYRGYRTYMTNHPDGTGHAGTAIIVRDTIKHDVLPEFKTEYIQATTIAVRDSCGYFNISAVYCPPKHIISENMFSNYFKTLGGRFISGGDWNAKHTSWGSRLITTRGRQLQASVTSMNLRTISAGEPTYWPTDTNKLPDLLDFFICKGLSSSYLRAESCLDGSSDHTPVLLSVSAMVIEAERPPTVLHYVIITTIGSHSVNT